MNEWINQQNKHQYKFITIRYDSKWLGILKFGNYYGDGVGYVIVVFADVEFIFWNPEDT